MFSLHSILPFFPLLLLLLPACLHASFLPLCLPSCPPFFSTLLSSFLSCFVAHAHFENSLLTFAIDILCCCNRMFELMELLFYALQHAFLYYTLSFTSSDINECTAGTSTCSPNAICLNNAGSFTCTCKEGFIGDGSQCDGN